MIPFRLRLLHRSTLLARLAALTLCFQMLAVPAFARHRDDEDRDRERTTRTFTGTVRGGFNRDNFRLETRGRTITVEVPGGYPRRLSENDYVRVRGYFEGEEYDSKFRAGSVDILRDADDDRDDHDGWGHGGRDDDDGYDPDRDRDHDRRDRRWRDIRVNGRVVEVSGRRDFIFQSDDNKRYVVECDSRLDRSLQKGDRVRVRGQARWATIRRAEVEITRDR
jgi:hypothetical protein